MSRGPQKESFAAQVRRAIADLSAEGKECSVDAISIRLRIMTRQEHKRLLNTLHDLFKRGKLIRVKHGVYQLAPQNKPVEKRQVMWRLLRMRRAITADDLVEMADVCPQYAAEWLRTLLKHKIVRQQGTVYRLIKDTVQPPELTDNADKLRKLREKKKKAALKALDVANIAISKAKTAVNDL